jgi:hypothetical protein
VAEQGPSLGPNTPLRAGELRATIVRMASIYRARCHAETQDGEPCQAPPVHQTDFCFWHHADYQAEAQEARRLGGVHRRREQTILGSHDIEGLDTVEDILRVLEIAVIDALRLENSVARSRTLIAGALAALRVIEVREQEEAVKVLEALYP